jgi:hypothetical protein
MMLGVLLYAIYSRIYSAHQIEKATYTYSDFWFFTHKERISQDKISKFLNLHEKEIKNIFLETILLADRNKLLDFNVMYQDGFLLKANASKKKNRTINSLNKKKIKISKALEIAIEKLKDKEEDKELHYCPIKIGVFKKMLLTHNADNNMESPNTIKINIRGD